MSSNTVLILLAIVPDASLYTVSRRVNGLQFFKNIFGLLSFGMQVTGFQVGPTFPIFPTFPYFFDLLLLFPTFS